MSRGIGAWEWGSSLCILGGKIEERSKWLTADVCCDGDGGPGPAPTAGGHPNQGGTSGLKLKFCGWSCRWLLISASKVVKSWGNFVCIFKLVTDEELAWEDINGLVTVLPVIALALSSAKASQKAL